jgi:transposase
MKDHQLYQQLLGIVAPWKVVSVELQRAQREVWIRVERSHRNGLRCPQCEAVCPSYDARERRWRHLDTMQYRTILIAAVPRIECKEHGVLQSGVPWAEAESRFTALFEALAIDWMLEANLTAVGKMLCLSWDEVAGIQRRAVERGLERRALLTPEQIGVDETSFAKRHEYVTVVNELGARPRVLYVAEGRETSALDGFYEKLGKKGCAKLTAVAMDMWAAYIGSTRAHVPDADAKIVFDKFHVAQHLGQAVDQVRRAEQRELRARQDGRLVGTRYHWLSNPESLGAEQWVELEGLRESSLRTARAYAIKESIRLSCWDYVSRTIADRRWKAALSWMMRCRLEPMKRVARMIRAHYAGVLNAATRPITNAHSERINEKIQWIKRISRGFRNRDRFKNAIYFHLGDLDLYPSGLGVTHTKPG